MLQSFRPRSAVTGVGSLSFIDPDRALDLIFETCPEIPFWPQLPGRAGSEGMIEQAAGQKELAPEAAAGFFASLVRIRSQKPSSGFFKGQWVGPWTLALYARDEGGRTAIRNNRLTHLLIERLCGQVNRQISEITACGLRPIMVLDEPGITSLKDGSLGIPRGKVLEVWKQLISGFRSRGALVGLHSCAHGSLEWLIESGADLISFDAFGDMNVLLEQHIAELSLFVKNGGWIAWGAVPAVERRLLPDPEAVAGNVERAVRAIGRSGAYEQKVFEQSLITSSCGLAQLSEENNRAVLSACRSTSILLRKKFLKQEMDK